MRRRIVLLAGLTGMLCLALGGAALARAHRAAAARHVGALVLRRCTDGDPGFCGDIRRPLDPGLRGGPTIPVGFEWIPATDGHARRATTIVAVEGGPGYPSSGSDEEYTGTFAPELTTHNLLMVDNRGTGRSAVIRCPSLDDLSIRARAFGPAFDRRVGRCGADLDHEYHTRSGRPIHAADLFATEYAVGDLHAVLGRLQTGRVDLYGDSYGSWFAQAYMARYPHDLRAVILDSTYAIHDLDPYYASSGSSGRAALNQVCTRSLACRTDAGPGTAVSRLAALLRRVRAHPIRVTVLTTHGRQAITVTPRRLVDLFQNGGSDPYPWREFDASVRAALAGDPTPLARLLIDNNDNGGDADPGYFSDGDYMAVSCTDYPQLFSMTAPPWRRLAQYRARLADAPPGAFAPFSAAEWVQMSGYSETYDSCLDWPAPVHHAPVLAPVGRRRLPASVPVLVVGGDLDDLTPLSDARRFAPSLGRRVRVVDLRNTVHVTSEGDTYLGDGAACARAIIDRFVAAPGRLARLNVSCARRIPPLQTPGAYPRTLAAASAARQLRGPRLSPAARRAVTIAAGALADVAARAEEFGTQRGVGLYGGWWTRSDDAVSLRGVRLTTDTRVSGQGTVSEGVGAIRGRLTVTARRLRVTVTLRWTARAQRARASVGATRLSLPAP